MGATKVMIVDDSSFSRAILAGILQDAGCEVVGEAESFESLIETYKNSKPDIVTMDIAMPGKDGFECSKELLLYDKSAKIILVSSMKDEETELEAKRIGVSGYVQKPVDEENLMRIINKVIEPDTLYQQVEGWAQEIFKETLSQSITRMTKATATITEKEAKQKNVSQGITVIIGIIGMYSGMIITDLSVETAEKITEVILRRPAKNQDEVLSMVAEFANVVGGIACSMLNKKEKSLSFRVAPPSVSFGESIQIVNPTIKVHSVCAKTDFGDINFGFGFKKESILWM